jgi:PD-(D/E)XK endonuclease
MASLKMKGDLAELKVATDLLERGYKIAIPYGEDWDFDLIIERHGALERVQVKHAKSNGEFIPVRCRSQSLTNGKVRKTKRYTAETSTGLPSMTGRRTVAITSLPLSWDRVEHYCTSA